MRIACFLLTLILVCGCGDSGRKDVPVKLDTVPENIRKIAQDNLKEVTFDKATKKADGSWELSGKDKRGKVREIDISPEGKVLEIE